MYKYPGSGNFIKAFDIVRREIAFLKVLAEYENALVIRQDRIDKLYDEIKIIKKLKI